MLRSSLVAASAVILCTAASAQQQIQAKKVLGPVRSAGTYHVATGTWTRGGSSSNISPDAIYRNDAPSGYFGTGWENCWSVDEAMLPGPGNPFNGLNGEYFIDGLAFTYCKQGAGTVDWYFGFYDGYTPCDDPSAPANCINEIPGFVVPGLPGSSFCWIVTLDLAGGSEVCLQADGGGCTAGYQGSGLGLDHGGIGFAWDTSDNGLTGPLLTGDPAYKPQGEGTCYLPGFTGCAADATGLGATDLFSISNHNGFPCAVGNGCYWFGGYIAAAACGGVEVSPFASFGFTLFADCTADCGAAGTVYCDETQNANNVADIAISTVVASSSSIDVSITGGPNNQFTYLLVGNGQNAVNNPPGSKGSLCVVGGNCLGRYDKDVQQIGVGSNPSGEAHTDIKNAISNPCNGNVNIVAGATWNFQYWHRQPMGLPTTFSSAVNVTFQ
jgi:hypothetical protein